MSLTTAPSFVGSVDQNLVVERLGGAKDPFYYLIPRFPIELYRQSPDTTLYKFMRTLLGETGVGSLRQNYLQARLLLDELGIDSFNLDAFYGDPLKFGRILEESYLDDPTGLLSQDRWNEIRAKDARYRNRALDFVSGARGGNTPEGIRLVAKSGLNTDVEVVENYRFLYDVHSDTPMGLPYQGSTVSTEEFVIYPRPIVDTLEIQKITIHGTPEPPNSGTFQIVFNGQSTADYPYVYNGTTLDGIPYNGTMDHVRLALEQLPQVGPGGVSVSGGPGPNTPWEITFTDATNVPEITTVNDLLYTSGSSPVPGNFIDIEVSTVRGGHQATDNVVGIPDADRYYLQEALDRTRPQTSIPTLGRASGLRSQKSWRSILASSEYAEVGRYVTGTSNVLWPPPDGTFWIQPDIEIAGPKTNSLSHHYSGFHEISNISASSGQGVGFAAADYAEPLFVTASNGSPLVNDIYPIDYQGLPGTPAITYNSQWWTSEFGSDPETLEVELTGVRAINNLSFEIGNRPVEISVEYDILDEVEDRQFVPVQPVQPYNNLLANDATDNNAWASVGLTFRNGKGQMIFARRLRITFTRLQGYTGKINVRNLRVARNVA